jgi:GT2 family glycosyltransferase
MQLSVMITSRNRAADLRRTCRVLRKLNPAPLEILITADGCTDDTIEMVKAGMLETRNQKPEVRSQKLGSKRPDYRTTDDGTVSNTETLKAEIGQVRLIVNEAGKGSVASRDRMMREAKGDLVLALDDDSYPEQLDCLAHIVPLFEQNPNLAIAHFPQRTDEYPKTLTQTDFGPPRLTRSFANSGAVLRRSTYLQLPGFETKFFHAYEEPDYALQCVAAGYEVLFTPLVTIRHHYSGVTRSEMRTHHRHSRNELWSVLLRCPFPQCLGLAAYRIFSQFRYACKRGPQWILREPIWWWQVIKGVPDCLKKRHPIPWVYYKAWLHLG